MQAVDDFQDRVMNKVESKWYFTQENKRPRIQEVERLYVQHGAEKNTVDNQPVNGIRPCPYKKVICYYPPGVSSDGGKIEKQSNETRYCTVRRYRPAEATLGNTWVVDCSRYAKKKRQRVARKNSRNIAQFQEEKDTRHNSKRYKNAKYR